jgi:uncharacterized protein (TIGR02466 family)
MSVRDVFATRIYSAPLQRTGLAAFNARLLRECEQLRHDDVAGRRWSRRNYPGGYTSYGSLCRLHQISSGFGELERRLRRHLRSYAAALGLDLTGRSLTMTDCWINVMGRNAVHGLHLHPLSTISGTYYVRVPRGSPAIKFEDPRLDRFMASPPRPAGSTWVQWPARSGDVVLFESWLRHEVPPNPVASERVSVSFNYSWF